MKILIGILLVLLLFVAYQTFNTRRLISVGIGLADRVVPFSREYTDARARILVIGDSTAVGTGAETPEVSLAGLAGGYFPDAELINRGVNGAKAHELISRLESLKGYHFDLIMIHIGGNDIVRFTDLNELALSIATVLDLTTALADNVTLTTTGNMATARLLPYGTRWRYEKRTRQVRDIFKGAAQARNVYYVDLFREKPVDPFAQDPDKYYASDEFHPSGAGYADWFTIISKSLEQISLEVD